MSKPHDDIPLREGLELLVSLREGGAEPSAAMAQLHTRPLGSWEPDLAWELDPVTGRWDYDLIWRHSQLGAVSLTWVPKDGVPFPLRHVQHASDMVFVRIDGRPVMTHEAMTLFDSVWEDHPLLNQMVNFGLLQKEFERNPIEVPVDDLERELDTFRMARGLMTAAQTEAWLHAHGMTLASLEQKLENEIRLRLLRRREMGAAARALFDADRRAFDRVSLTAFPMPPQVEAHTIIERLGREGDLLGIARETLADRQSERRATRSISFESLFRRDVVLSTATTDLTPGSFAALMLRGVGPYIAQVDEIKPAEWNAATRNDIERDLFEKWFSERRRAARIEWNWGNGQFSGQE